MASLLGGYAGQYNRRHARSGYVFENRYKSILCDADSYLLQLVRYIHLNPLKARMVKTVSELDRYRWTGHAGLLGRHLQPWQTTDAILELFSKRRSSAHAKYRQFVVEGLHENRDEEFSGGGLIRSFGSWEAVRDARKEHALRIGDERILGDGDFVEQVLREDHLNLTEKAALEQQGMSLEQLIGRVCKRYAIKADQLMQKGRANDISVAKALICYWGIRKLGVTTVVLAKRFGISQSAVSQTVWAGIYNPGRRPMRY